jgi:hypothetical protein
MPVTRFTINSRSLISFIPRTCRTKGTSVWRSAKATAWQQNTSRLAMETPDKQSRIRVELTPEQRKVIKDASGEEVTTLEFTAQELEERIAPRLQK